MNTMDFGTLHVVAGVRFEGTQMNTLGYNVTLYPGGQQELRHQHRLRHSGAGHEQSFLRGRAAQRLPPVSLSTRNSGLRLVYGRGVSRPDAYQLVPYVTQDDSTNPATVALGNPALKPEHANNYDLLYERYLHPAGMIQAGFFYKQLTNTLISTSYTATSGTVCRRSRLAVAQRQQRAPLRLRDLLPAAAVDAARTRWAASECSANYSWTGSQIKAIPGRLDSPALQRQAPNTWNISPTYDRGRVLGARRPFLQRSEHLSVSIPDLFRREPTSARPVPPATSIRCRTYSSTPRRASGSAMACPRWFTA